MNQKHPHEDLPSLSEIREILLSGKWWIISIFLFAATATYLYVSTLTPEYEARSTIFVDLSQQNEIPGFGAGDQRSAAAMSERLAADIAIVQRSSDLAEQVARRLISVGFSPFDGEQLPILIQYVDPDTANNSLTTRFNRMLGTSTDNPANYVMLDVPRVARRIPRHITIMPIRGVPNMFDIIAVSSNPGEASLLANIYAEEYARYDRDRSREKIRATLQYLQTLERDQHQSLRSYETQIRKFLETDYSLVTDPAGQRAAEQLSDLYRQIDETQHQINTTRRLLEILKKEEEDTRQLLSVSRSTNIDQQITVIRSRILDLQIQAEDYYIERPELRQFPERNANLNAIVSRIQSLEASIERLNREVSENIQRGVMSQENLTTMLQQLRQDYNREDANLQALEERLIFLRNQANEFQGNVYSSLEKSHRLSDMERDRRINEELYTRLLTTLQETQIAERAELGRVRIVSEAGIPGAPARPNKLLLMVLGMGLGLALSIGILFVKRMMDNTIHTPEELRQRGFNVLSAIPNMEAYKGLVKPAHKLKPVNGLKADARLVVLHEPLSPVSESYRRLRTNLLFSNVDKPVKSILITSSIPGEGKSLTAVNLAVVMAQAGKRTLLVDADLRKPAATNLLGLPAEPGLSDTLFRNGGLTIDEFTTPIDNLYVLPSGKPISNPSEFLGSKRMDEFIDAISASFDIVIFDSPPLQLVTDASILANKVDATIIVAQGDETTWQILENTRQYLQDVGVYVAGVVLNRFNFKSSTGYSRYGYEITYGKTYGASGNGNGSIGKRKTGKADSKPAGLVQSKQSV
ncbi:MAG: polysaccharide biosynthesis tyrosine autokinase [Balneolaceae bacterium]|nr:MAG: polysaccharide biosynthesis tyrosine autokinase [Balneolaceae bacterium]